MGVLQAGLDRMKNEWNRHLIRSNKIHPNGIPDYLYHLPQHRGIFFFFFKFNFATLHLHQIGLQDYSCACNDADLNVCWQYASDKPASNIPEFVTLAEILMEEEDLQVPSNGMEALSLYIDLVNLITQSNT